MEIDWGDKPNYTSYGCPMANWKGHETHNPNHMNESLLFEVDWGAHDSSVFLFLVNIDYDALPNESPIQGLWGKLQHRTSSIPLIANKNSSTCCLIASLRRHYRVTGVVKVLKQKE